MIRRSGKVAALGPLREFLRLEASGGVLLLFAAVVALGLANSPRSGRYG